MPISRPPGNSCRPDWERPLYNFTSAVALQPSFSSCLSLPAEAPYQLLPPVQHTLRRLVKIPRTEDGVSQVVASLHSWPLHILPHHSARVRVEGSRDRMGQLLLPSISQSCCVAPRSTDPFHHLLRLPPHPRHAIPPAIMCRRLYRDTRDTSYTPTAGDPITRILYMRHGRKRADRPWFPRRPSKTIRARGHGDHLAKLQGGH